MAYQEIFEKMLPRRVTLQYSDGANQRMLLKIDCTVSEELSLDAQATLHEVEEGAEICDHVIRKGRTLQLEGIVSDAPINLTSTLIGNTAGLAGAQIGGAAGAVTAAAGVIMANLALSGSAKPSKAALDIFEEIYANSVPLTIVAGLSTYTNMVMERFTAPRNAANAGALVFRASFRQVRIVSGQTVTVPMASKADDIKDLSATEQQRGARQGSVLDGAKSQKAASWALQIGRAIVGGD